MVGVKVRAHHVVNILDPKVSRRQSSHAGVVCLHMPIRPARHILIVANVAINKDGVIRGLNYVGLKAKDELAGYRLMNPLIFIGWI